MTPDKQVIVNANEEIKKEAWDLWITHPTTQQLLRNLEKHRVSFLGKMEANVVNSSIPDNLFRQWTSNAKTISTIMQACKDYNLFNQLSNLNQ